MGGRRAWWAADADGGRAWFIFLTSSSSSESCISALVSVAAFASIFACSMSVSGTSAFRCISSSAMRCLRALALAKPSALADAAAFLEAAARRSISPDAVSFMRCSSTVESTLWSSVLPTSPWMLFICCDERTATSRMLPDAALLPNRDSSACASESQS